MRFSLFVLFILGCHQAQPGIRQWVPERDSRNFTLPEDVRSLAPNMQEDYLSVIRYPSASFQIKPKFVFVDQGAQTVGPPDAFVSRLDLFHFQVWQAGLPVRHATILFEPEQGASLYGQKGGSIDLIPKGGKLTVELSEYPEFGFSFDSNSDVARVQEIQDTKIFFYFLRPIP